MCRCSAAHPLPVLGAVKGAARRSAADPAGPPLTAPALLRDWQRRRNGTTTSTPLTDHWDLRENPVSIKPGVLQVLSRTSS